MTEKLIVLYEENGRVYRHYKDLRHRIIMRFAIIIAFTVIASVQIYSYEEIRSTVISLLFILLGVSSIMSMLMHLRNWKATNSCAKAGSAIEKKLFEKDPEFIKILFYSTQHRRNRAKRFHASNSFFVIIYLGTACFSFLISYWVSTGILSRLFF